MKSQKVFLTKKQSPLQIINVAVDPPLNIFIRNSDECKTNRDCIDGEFCWNGYCFPYSNLGDACLTDDHCFAELVCSKLNESKDGICITPLTKNDTKNDTDGIEKPEINFPADNEMNLTDISTEILPKSILAHKNEDDIKNEITTEFLSNFTTDIGKIIVSEENSTTDLPSSTSETNIFDGIATDTSTRIIAEISSTTEITILSSLATKIVSEGTLLTIPMIKNETEDNTSSTMSSSSSTTEITTEDLLSTFPSFPVIEITSEDNTTQRFPTFPIIESTTNDTSSMFSSLSVTEVINNDTMPTVPPPSNMTEITSQDGLSTLSSASENATKDEITEFFSLVTTNESVFTVIVKNDSNINETKKEVSTIFSTNIPELSTTSDSPKEIISEIESSSKNHSKIVNMESSYPSDSSNDSSITDLQHTVDDSSDLTSETEYWCDSSWKFFRGRCYTQMDESSYTYYEAKENCMNMGAVLVTIANKDITEFLYCKFFFIFLHFIMLFSSLSLVLKITIH
ncbi:hypothetical protein ACH3XW_44775 [Acanthocheilonema viteae]